ncbi:hypothetical protein SLEP1_g15130 [Rubroshorea leprosula]|uniref:Uncharacterized protein n=1 Tax=Rubroshorea leprosula TaxID=152421 RepID=A0AAV5IU75_9ROSI|nr:hypothetical protein SLEP1_g15130 [Rubroshorea leprosula]
MRKLGFCLSFLVQEPDLELRNLSPCKNFWICSALSVHLLLLLVCGCEFL